MTLALPHVLGLAKTRLFSNTLLLVALLCCTACSDSVQLKPLDANDTVLAFGDSLTFGSGAPPQQSYPAQLAQLIDRKVMNAGVPGEVSAKGLVRLAKLLDEHKPALLILCHGGNDFLRKQPLVNTRSNIADMITMAKQKDVDIVLLATPTPGIFLSVPEFYQELADEFKLVYEDEIIAKIESQPALKSDAIHPNADGYRLIAEALSGLLKRHGAL